jgi:hypothetical protein
MTDKTSQSAIVEWHRVAGAKAIVRPLAIGATLLMMGPALAVTGILLGRATPSLVTPGLIAGGVCVVIGPIVALLGLASAVKEDAFLAARPSGITFERNGKGITIAWDELEAVSFEPPAALVFRRREGDPFVLHERFDIATDELAKRFETLRRKASMDLLKA